VKDAKFEIGTKLRVLVDRASDSRLADGEIVELVGINGGLLEVKSEHTGHWILYWTDIGTTFEIVDTPSGDAINHPAHYNQGKIEVIEFIEDKKLGFHLGNAVKYISRAGKKDPAKEIEDLKKAVWYIERQIELVSGGTRRPNEMVQK
jgi:hypothetical protein